MGTFVELQNNISVSAALKEHLLWSDGIQPWCCLSVPSNCSFYSLVGFPCTDSPLPSEWFCNTLLLHHMTHLVHVTARCPWQSAWRQWLKCPREKLINLYVNNSVCKRETAGKCILSGNGVKEWCKHLKGLEAVDKEEKGKIVPLYFLITIFTEYAFPCFQFKILI